MQAFPNLPYPLPGEVYLQFVTNEISTQVGCLHALLVCTRVKRREYTHVKYTCSNICMIKYMQLMIFALDDYIHDIMYAFMICIHDVCVANLCMT